MSSKTGRVKFYSYERGFGYISTQTDGDFFFHITHVLDQLPPKVGDSVTFMPSKDERRGRIHAAQVRVIESPRRTPPKTLKGFPCIKGQEIIGFRVKKTFGKVLAGDKIGYKKAADKDKKELFQYAQINGLNLFSNFSTANEAREELIRFAQFKGANAIFNFHLHKEKKDIGIFSKSWELTFWAEGEAVLLMPE